MDNLAAKLGISPVSLWRYRYGEGDNKRSPCARVRKTLIKLCEKHGLECKLSDI